MRRIWEDHAEQFRALAAWMIEKGVRGVVGAIKVPAPGLSRAKTAALELKLGHDPRVWFRRGRINQDEYRWAKELRDAIVAHLVNLESGNPSGNLEYLREAIAPIFPAFNEVFEQVVAKVCERWPDQRSTRVLSQKTLWWLKND